MADRCQKITVQGRRCKQKVFYGSTKCVTHTESQCAICMEKVSTKNTIRSKRLSCGHPFHMHCILSWYKEADTCPICRVSQDNDDMILFKKGIEESMRQKYKDAIEDLEHDLYEAMEALDGLMHQRATR